MDISETSVVAVSIFFLSFLFYYDERAANGAFIYDDLGTVTRNQRKQHNKLVQELFAFVYMVEFVGDVVDVRNSLLL